MRDMIQRRRRLGTVYTPRDLADWAAQLLVRYLPEVERSLILDPACGDGALLRSVRSASPGCRLAGIDIDGRAIVKARRTLRRDAFFVRADALCSLSQAEASERRRILRDELPIGVIANPPWGASVLHSRARLNELGYALAQGQFDSFELFIELSLKMVKPGGALVFIVPDSIFQPEHVALRRLLCTKTKIKLIARLGEGFFENVYRGTVVIAVTHEMPSDECTTACLRLPPEWRSQVLNGKRTLAEAERELAHPVPQSRFRTDPKARFDIDLAEAERARICVFERHVDGWTNWLISGRGVELSKHGLILRCPHCKHACPHPHDEQDLQCGGCGRRFSPQLGHRETIVLPTEKGPRGWRPLIVGEDVNRYEAIASRFIKPGVPGINYKSNETFDGRKMLVRKTGVGIKAAIDESQALTNQVVFIYRMKSSSRQVDFMLDYFLGVLCSRLMLAYYLKTRGENEWRSHPYLTQRIISEMPVPNVREGTWQWRQARAIADAVRNCAKTKLKAADILVDRLVAGLFELSESDCLWSLRVLEEAQSLEPIRTLRLADREALQPLRV